MYIQNNTSKSLNMAKIQVPKKFKSTSVYKTRPMMTKRICVFMYFVCKKGKNNSNTKGSSKNFLSCVNFVAESSKYFLTCHMITQQEKYILE